MFEKVNVKEINPHAFLLDEPGEATGYMVVGKEKAVVINIHGHFNHIAGNIFLKNGYIWQF